jgi:hypothetical protein
MSRSGAVADGPPSRPQRRTPPQKQVGAMSVGAECGQAGSEILSAYMSLRRMVGWIGTLLPATLITGNMIFTRALPDSMSDYYYTHMRNLLIAALSVLGIFLICYAGYDTWDRWLTNLSGIGLIGVAFCVPSPPMPVTMSTLQRVIADLHFTCAAVALVALSFMALRFTRSYATPDNPAPGVMNWVRAAFGFAPDGPGPPRTRAKQRRDRVYRVCGFSMFGTMALAGLANIVPASAKHGIPFLFIFEALTVIAFGVSWLVKGQAMVMPAALKDQQPDRIAAARVGAMRAG